ncbi:MAG: pyruvate dehydrogenase (acetyl-transferring), homodimeric type, partial [Opitutae bacterium]|nr:pyruvate dehydrogenase (acetyl-transferring), homodimeric type [Opitutae bacterium]
MQEELDTLETQEWIDSVASVIREDGAERAKFLLDKVFEQACLAGVDMPSGITTNYINSIPTSEEPEYPGDKDIERRIRAVVRWNAVMMVLRASGKDLELGGHIASYQSSSAFYEVCFNHFFRAPSNGDSGDLIYYQGHISP